MKKLTPFGTRLIVKVLDHDQEFKSAGGIILGSESKREKSTFGEVLIPNTESYTRDNKSRDPLCRAGDVIMFEQGNIGDELPHSPEGETWLAIPEECVIMRIEEL